MNYPQRKIMTNMDNYFSGGLNLTYFPIDNIPVGFSTGFSGGNIYGFGKTISTNQNNTQGYVVNLNNSIFNGHIGFKISNQNSKSILTPYFIPRIGITNLATAMTLTRVTDHPLNETESEQLNRERLYSDAKFSYYLEGGLEISPFVKVRTRALKESYKVKVSLNLSFTYIGSFSNIEYYNNYETSKGVEQFVGLSNYQEMKNKFRENTIISKSRLAILQLNSGITIRF
jgi:hypothetical protein